MRRIFGIGVALLGSLLLVSCDDKPAAPVNFDPMTLGPSGATLDKYLKRSAAKPSTTDSSVMDVEIKAALPNLEKEGVMKLERTVNAAGRVSYEVKGYVGDNTVKKDVIARVLSNEQQSSETQSLGITASNYRFRFKRTDSVTGKTALVFELIPRRKADGLFRGELWLEDATGLELKQSGRLVKNPSVIFKSVDFVREYEIKDDKALISKMDSVAETRVVGPVKMTMTFTNHRTRAAESNP